MNGVEDFFFQINQITLFSIQQVPAQNYISLPDPNEGRFFILPTALVAGIPAMSKPGLKVVCLYRGGKKRGIQNITALVISMFANKATCPMMNSKDTLLFFDTFKRCY